MTASFAVWNDTGNQTVAHLKTPSGAYRHLIFKDYEIIYTDENYNALITLTP